MLDKRLIYILLFITNSAIGQGWQVLTNSTAACANSNNGTILVTYTLNGGVPLGQMPYPLPYDVSYEHADGDIESTTMNSNPLFITNLKSGLYKITIYYDDACYTELEVEVPDFQNLIQVQAELSNVKCDDLGTIVLDVSGLIIL